MYHLRRVLSARQLINIIVEHAIVEFEEKNQGAEFIDGV